MFFPLSIYNIYFSEYLTIKLNKYCEFYQNTAKQFYKSMKKIK